MADGAGIGEDQAAHTVGNGGVLLHAPVVDLQIVIHRNDQYPHCACKKIEIASFFNELVAFDLNRGIIQFCFLKINFPVMGSHISNEFRSKCKLVILNVIA